MNKNMDAKQFKSEWTPINDNLEPFDEKSISSLKISEISKDYLKVGLPSEAAPFLSFGYTSGAFLQSAAEEFDLSVEYDNFKIIGYNAYGDPICLNENEDDIVYLNHDDEFGYVLMNSSLGQLACFLLVYREFKQKLKKIPYAEVKELIDTTIKRLQDIDSDAVDEGDWEDSLRLFVE